MSKHLEEVMDISELEGVDFHGGDTLAKISGVDVAEEMTLEEELFAVGASLPEVGVDFEAPPLGHAP
eukprot:5174915-Pyramimonas_sp.AAC.1